LTSCTHDTTPLVALGFHVMWQITRKLEQYAWNKLVAGALIAFGVPGTLN
jgi:hypothetical protein